MSAKPLISVVITCYNDHQFIEEALYSVLNQTYENIEIILVDDGSEERTKTVLKKLEPKIDILITQENLGLSAARNNGIKEASGEIIVILDSDDYFEIHFCEAAVKHYLYNYPKYKVITCQARRFNEKGEIDIFTPKGGNLESFLFSNAALATSLFSKKDWSSIEGYDQGMMNGYEDWEFFIRLLKNGGEVFVIKEPLFNYRQKPDSLRIKGNKVKYDNWEYIFLKHQDLYINKFEPFVRNISKVLKELELEKQKILTRKEFRLGLYILKPVRFLTSILINKP